METKFTIINGNSYEELKKFPDNYFDAVVTDPPYGLGNEPNAEQMLSAWISVGYLEVKGSGFMGKEWDAFVPQPNFWKEVYRVLKHGGHVVAFYGTRTYDWGVMAMRLGGFEIRDCIQWVYGSGFPKSHNISKAIDKSFGVEREIVGEIKRGDVEKAKQNGSGYLSDPANRNNEKQFGYGVEQITISTTEQAKQWDGWGSALKPANEPIVLARKPLEKGLSIAENVMKWGTGGINIDGCRVKGNEPKSFLDNGRDANGSSYNWSNTDRKETFYDGSQGRFPANLILTHHSECECNGLKKVKAISGGKGEKSLGGLGKNGIYGRYALKLGTNAGGLGDENGQETIEDWTCHEDCPIKIMDEQSGDRKGWASQNHKSFNPYGGNSFNKSETDRNGFHNGYNDNGGASRFFYCAKASKSERNFGLGEFEKKRPDLRDSKSMGSFEEKGVQPQKNFHPTVKPVKLMQYLIRLITPPNGKVLDPFNGSGTTGVASMLENVEYTGIELDADYCKISEARIKSWNELDEYEQYQLLNEPEQANPNHGIQTKLF